MPRTNYREPLNPFADPDDISRYLPIDDLEQMFAKFQLAFGNPRTWTSTGHLIVVAGDRGCGKSSLIQRCAYWLTNHQQADCQVLVLDLSEESWPGDTRERRIERIFDRIKHLLDDRILDASMALLTPEHDLTDSFFYLGEALRAGTVSSPLPIALAVLLPALRDSPVEDELSQYESLAAKGIFFFVEVLTDGSPGNARGHGGARGKDVHHLAAGRLKDGDVSLLVDFIRREQAQLTEIPDSIVRSIAHDKTSAAEVTFTTHEILRIALESGKSRVTEEHLIAYYQPFWNSSQPDQGA